MRRARLAALGGRRVVLIGASSGIGLAAARAFAAAGADLALLARGQDGLQQAASAARAQGRRALVLPVDVTDTGALEAAIARAARELGGIDVLVLNAGGLAFGPFDQTPPADVRRTLDVILVGAIDATRAALPYLRASGGVIVATVSIAALGPVPLLAAYAAAKHGLRGFLSSLRVELRAQRSAVRVCMVNPGPVDTPLWDRVDTATGRLPARPPLMARPERVAAAIVRGAAQPRAVIPVGPLGLLYGPLCSLAPAVSDRALAFGMRWMQRAGEPARESGVLSRPAGDRPRERGRVGPWGGAGQLARQAARTLTGPVSRGGADRAG